jgi:hypothetical protein
MVNPLLEIAIAVLAQRPPKPRRQRSPIMLRAFNAFQIVALFSAMPYLIGWLGTSPFPYSLAAMWTSVVVYVVLFIVHVMSLSDTLGN